MISTLLFGLLCSCGPKKHVITTYELEPFPALESIPPMNRKRWLDSRFSASPPEEQKSNWTLLLNEEFVSFRQEALATIISDTNDTIITTAFLGNPDAPAFERCFVAIHALLQNMDINTDLIPSQTPTPNDKLYCSLLYSMREQSFDTFFRVFQQQELPLERTFYELLTLIPFPKADLETNMKEKLLGEEDDFGYLSLYTSWFLLDSDRVQGALITHLLQAEEDDRMEVIELLWGNPKGIPIFEALANTEKFSGIYATIAQTAAGQEDVGFTLEYMQEGKTWELRLWALEALGIWYGIHPQHKKSAKVRSELLNLIETENTDVLLSLLRGLQRSQLREAIEPLRTLKPSDPLAELERIVALRTLSLHK